MLLGGDEIGRTQRGNNNAWCQDNEISWYDWTDTEEARLLRDFTRGLIRLRREHPVFRRDRYLAGEELRGSGLPDIRWLRADGRRMTQRDWQSDERVVGVFLNGAEIVERSRRGEEIVDDSFLLLFNASGEDHGFLLPPRRFGALWQLELTTADPYAEAGGERFPARADLTLVSRSVVLLKRAA
jgi:isoamylase